MRRWKKGTLDIGDTSMSARKTAAEANRTHQYEMIAGRFDKTVQSKIRNSSMFSWGLKHPSKLEGRDAHSDPQTPHRSVRYADICSEPLKEEN